MKSIQNNYIAIQGWMAEGLGLRGNELLVYALIHGFSQDGQSQFTGSIAYVQQWLGCARQTVFNTLQSLEKKGLIQKKEILQNGLKYCTYCTVVKKLDTQSKNKTEGVQILDKTSLNIGPNNIYNIEDNIKTPMFDEVWVLYGMKGNYLKAKEAYYNLNNSERSKVYRHLTGSEHEVGYVETTEAIGRKYRQNFENYFANQTYLQPLQPKEYTNIELI